MRYDQRDRLAAQRTECIGTNESRTANTCSKKWPQPDVIAAIKRGDVFYSTDANGDLVKLIVATHNGHEYVKTENYGIQPDNLLAKPECK